jgi:hypothetical protein
MRRSSCLDYQPVLLLSINIVKTTYSVLFEIRDRTDILEVQVVLYSDTMMVVVLAVHCVVAGIHLVPTACSLVAYLKYVIRCNIVD